MVSQKPGLARMDEKRRLAPVGVWILTACNGVFVLPVPVLFGDEHLKNRGGFLSLAFFLLLGASLVGTLLGSKMGRNIMLAMIAGFFVWVLVVALSTVGFTGAASFWAPVSLFYATLVAVNYWYFLRRKGSQFFSARRGS
jgi:hypothetical protein